MRITWSTRGYKRGCETKDLIGYSNKIRPMYVGANLAKHIPLPDKDVSIYDYME